MKTVNGFYTSANIYTDTIDDYALAQIQILCDHKAFEGCRIRIMPDVHPGKVGTIGFTSTVGKQVIPSVVGIDIGCGVTMVKLKQKKAEYQKLDTVIRDNIPAGFKTRRTAHRFNTQIDLSQMICCGHIHLERAKLSFGTLGGGNHFIELDKDEEGHLYAAVHSGSRHLGKEVTEYYLKEGQKYLKAKGIQVPYEMTFLEDQLLEDYIHDLQVVQEFAALNRKSILDELIKGMKWKVEELISSVHNYIDCSGNERILRKGAVSARKGEHIILPINMRDGILIGNGLGNEDWNLSAPHGAGRILKRETVKQKYTVSQFKKEMKGIYSSCIGPETLDEAPFAYRGITEIEKSIGETMTIENVLTPIYNFKAGSK